MSHDSAIAHPGLTELLAKAKQLNQASDHVNAILKDLEAKLSAANIGLTFWFESKPLYQSDSRGDLSPSSTYEDVAEVLGYARIDGKWNLAVKKLRTVHGFYEGQMDCPWANTFADGDPMSLLKAPRETRLAAVRIIDEFIAAFTAMVNQTVGELEAASGEIFFGKQ
ncbi:MAG TPA: hypothetical protein VG538_05730 [Vicinamibacterales bacterium]|jgi:hypothetical protein|nr:hypothetical protein [Vicinamibacterales bacterium]